MSLKNRKTAQDNVFLDGPRPAGVRRSSSLLSTKKLLSQSNCLEASELEALQLSDSPRAKMSPSSKKQTHRSCSLDTAELESLKLKYSLTSKMIPREQNITEDDLERSDGIVNYAYIKYNKTFHKLFPEIPEGESLTYVFTCSLQREVLYHGKLFVSDYHLCFYSSVLLKETKVMIPISSVKELKKHNSALSMLSITTSSEKYLFASLRNLKFRLKLLQNVCSQLQEESGNSSPQLSPAEIDGVRDTISSSSSFEGSIEQDSSSIDLDPSFLQMIGEVPSTSSSSRQSSLPEKDHRAMSLVRRVTDSFRPFSFRDAKNYSVLFYVYVLLLLLLLLASGYIGLRIMALEEQLSSLGPLSDLHREFQET